MLLQAPSSATLLNRYTFLSLLVAASLGLALVLYSDSTYAVVQRLQLPQFARPSPAPSPTPKPPLQPAGDSSASEQPVHPIDHLISAADLQLAGFYSEESHSLHDAAQAYRERRGRQPPPFFDQWYEFAANRSTLIVEEFWDQIYHDINPFWGVPAKQIREQAHDFMYRIIVRNGNVTFHSDGADRPWMVLWSDLIRTVAPWLPDMDIPINQMDESRLLVPWEEIDGYMRKEKASRRVVPEAELKDNFHGVSYMDPLDLTPFAPKWVHEGPLWNMAAKACHPDTPGRSTVAEMDYTRAPPLTRTYPHGSYNGYVANFTLSKSPCENPSIAGLHGTFVSPVSLSSTSTFFPLFGGSKLPMNNEILLPAAMYWTNDSFYSGGNEHGSAWNRKKDRLIWRGAASGGSNRPKNWTRFQRHRFISMVNGTSVRDYETNSSLAPPNFVLPDQPLYNLSTRSPDSEPGTLGNWLSTFTDAAVVNLLCSPRDPDPKLRKLCPYTNAYFSIADSIPMSEQYNYKYLPDIDGNSFSGRYRGFLGSTSLPIKATIYQEWHDSRLVPWKHFVPMDNSFVDIYGILEYFLGYKNGGVKGHDSIAEQIAMGGKEWTEKVLRREDMQVYTLRLLLEYARLCDDDREVLGWKGGSATESALLRA